MEATKLRADEIKKAETLLDKYFKQRLNQNQLNLDTSAGVEEQKLFVDVLINNKRPKDKDFIDFMHDRIWAIHETLYTGLFDEITRVNTAEELRTAFRNMLEKAHDAPTRQPVLDEGIRRNVNRSILSEILCKVYPDRYSIQNKRSEWGLSFILNSASPEFISKMNYDNFIGICWQIWDLIEKEYIARNLTFDSQRRLWYVDRFYLWIYERPKTKQIMKALGYKD